MALKAVRCCANTILHLPALLLDTPTNEEVETAAVRLLRCLANRFVACARHPYRLVRREFLLLVASLDWDQLEHLERTWVLPNILTQIQLQQQNWLIVIFLY